MTDTAASLAADYAAALDWWREAGVDHDYIDEPTAWLAEPEVEEASPAPPPRTVPRKPVSPALERALAEKPGARIGGDPEHWPQTLEAFREYWLAEPSLDEGALRDRVLPAGPAEAPLMILVGQPEEGDVEALLSGPEGAMLGKILQAMGLAMDEVYLASCLPRVTPLPDWADLGPRGLAVVTRHHIALAAPQRLIAFGKGAALMSEGAQVPLLAAPQIETLMRSAAHKKRFWNAWLDFSA